MTKQFNTRDFLNWITNNSIHDINQIGCVIDKDGSTFTVIYNEKKDKADYYDKYIFEAQLSLERYRLLKECKVLFENLNDQFIIRHKTGANLNKMINRINDEIKACEG